MKTLNHIPYKLLGFALFLCLTTGGYAQAFIESKVIEKEFPAEKSTTVDITNKYGKVHFINWTKDSVKFIVTITIRSDDYTKIEKFKHNIEIDFTSSRSFITAITTINTNKNKFISDLVSLADPKNATENLVDIDYKVYIPLYVNLDVENKYGDVYLDDLKGSFDLVLAHGNLKANAIEGNSKIEVKFGDATINSAKKAWLTILYTDLQLKKADQLTLDCKSSDINIDEVKTLKINSRRDKFNISKLTNIYGISTFSDYRIDKFFHEINLDVKYGSLNIDNIASSFSFIKINSKYTDLLLMFSKGSSYNLDMIEKEVRFTYPQSITKIEQKQNVNDEKSTVLFGKIGAIPPSGSFVKIDAQDCNVTFIHKN